MTKYVVTMTDSNDEGDCCVYAVYGLFDDKDAAELYAAQHWGADVLELSEPNESAP